MKTIIRIFLAAILALATSVHVHAQGTLVDQESYATPISPYMSDVDGLYLTDQQLGEDFEQTFIPSLSVIDFVALEFESADVPATVEVNLYEGSPSIADQTLIATTTAVTMPSGFNNNNLGIAGIEDFYFSTPIPLTPGDDYYFVPALVSGGVEWSYVTLIDYYTYPNGELNVDGYPYVNNTEMWFQEGVLAVPEPSTLALVEFTCLLIFIFKCRSKPPVLILACASMFTFPVLSVNASQDSVVQVTASAAGLASVPDSELPHAGTFYIATINSNNIVTLPPYPMLPTNMMDLPAFFVTNDIYILDDTKGQLSSSSERMSSDAAAAAVQKQSQSIANLIEMLDTPPIPNGGPEGNTNNLAYHPNDLPPISDTANIWLLVTNDVPDIALQLENATGNNYQLLSATNLLSTNWCLGQILQGAYGNYYSFNPVPYTNATTFFKVHQATPIISISGSQGATEPTNSASGQVGYFYIYNESGQSSNIPVYFALTGTAQSGIDYSNIPDSVIITNGIGSAQINIYPIDDGLKPNQTVILTILQNTNYLIDPANYINTNAIIANPQVYPVLNGDNIKICPHETNNVVLQAIDPRGLTLSYTIVTWPTHGTLNTNGIPNCTYFPTDCYLGNDSFTFTASDGQYTSPPATVTLTITNAVYAYQQNEQTCRLTPTTPFQLGGDLSCGEATNFALLSGPEHGIVSGTVANCIYTSTNSSWTGADTFSFEVYDECGDFATNTVTVTVGDNNIVIPISPILMTGTNQALQITLDAAGGSACTEDTNYFTYTITSEPTNGTLTNLSRANVMYTPNHDFEGMDSFQFTASDGVWTSAVASVTIYVAGPPILTTECDPFGTAPVLIWTLDTNVTAMLSEGLIIQQFVLYSSTNADMSNSIAIITNGFSSGETSWTDWGTNTVSAGQTNYYAVRYMVDFGFSEQSLVFNSQLSDVVETESQNPNNLISDNSFWNVVTNLAETNNITRLQAPFSSTGTNAYYPGLYPLADTVWPLNTTWSNFTTMFIPTNTPLEQVQWSVAIDNESLLYVNGTLISTNFDNGDATWSSFKSFPANTIHYGTNNVTVQYTDTGGVNYFSLVVTTNTCGW